MGENGKAGKAKTGKERYIKGAVLGEGTFGVVTKAEDTLTQKVVAIKKIRLGNYREGINFTAIREIKLLKELRHPHVIELVDCFPHKRNLNLVFECCESDLEAVIKDKFIPLGTPEIKSYMAMTLQAVAYCHECWVLHRDLKPNNLLIAPDGALKLADFGLARVFGSPNRKWTHQVFARWYRAPELLLGSKTYGPGVDMWAVGCIFAELMLRKPYLPGNSDIDQLGKIYAALGTPTEETWPGHTTLPDYIEFTAQTAPNPRALFVTAPMEALDLLQALLAFDPSRRLSARDATRHPYFSSAPPATPYPNLPRPSKIFGEDGDVTAVHGGGGFAGAGDGDAFDRGGGRQGKKGVRFEDDAGGSGVARASGLMPPPEGGTTERKSGDGRVQRASDASDADGTDDKTMKRRKAGETPAPMSTGPHGGHGGLGVSGIGLSGMELNSHDRPALSTVDRAYLRKRKLDLDNAFEAASQDIEEPDDPME